MRYPHAAITFASLAFATTVAAQYGVAAAPSAPTTPEEAIGILESLSAECTGFPDSEQKTGCVQGCSSWADELKSYEGHLSTPEILEHATVDRIPRCRRYYEMARTGTAPPGYDQAKLDALADRLAAHLREYLEQALGASNSSSAGASSQAGLRSRGEISWDAYHHGDVISSVLNGDFDGLRERSLDVEQLLKQYLIRFQHHCSNYLPADAVTVVNRSTSVTTNGFGAVVDRQEIEERVTMAPRFVYSFENYDVGTEFAEFAIGALIDPSKLQDLIQGSLDWIRDMDLFFSVEPCQGTTAMQLGENLIRLTTSRSPLQSELDPSQLLAALKVDVSHDVERRDNDAKAAIAARYQREERERSVAETGARRERLATRPKVTFAPASRTVFIKYAEIPPGYVVPVPAPEQGNNATFSIENGFRTSGAINWIRLGWGQYAYDRYAHSDEENAQYEQDLAAALEEGGRILSCSYKDGPFREYWYKRIPYAADPAALRAKWANHPLLRIAGARETCPASSM